MLSPSTLAAEASALTESPIFSFFSLTTPNLDDEVLNTDKATFPLQTIINFQRNVYAWLKVDDADTDPSLKDVLSAKDILEDVQYSLFNIEQYCSQIIFNNIGICSFDILIASRDLAREYNNERTS